MSTPVTVALVIAAVAYVIVKRTIGEPLNARDLAGPPLILTGIGIYQLTKVDGLVAVDYAWLTGGVVIGVLCGAVRGATVRIFARDGVLWQRYGAWTFGTWLLSLVASGGFSLIAASAGMNPLARPIMLAIGVGMVGEMITLGLRALATGKSFSPDRKDSAAAHRDLLSEIANRVQRRGGPPQTEQVRVRDGIRWLSQGGSGGPGESGHQR